MKKLVAILLLSSLNLHAAEEGLLHQWRFGQAKNGTVAAKVGAPAKYSGSANLIKKNGLSRLQLKGTDSRAWVTDDYKTVKVPKKSITVEAWVSPAKLMRWGGIAGVIQDNGSYERGWLLGYVNRKFSFVIASEGRQKLEPYMQGTTNFQDNRWYHVVGTYDSDTNATRLFVNGKLEASHTNNSGAIFYPPNATFELGGYKDNDEFYRGAIGLQEISIYEKALSAEVVAKRFVARKSEFPLPLEALFVSLPQLRWEKRDTLQIEWELSDPLPVEISWKRADGKDARKILVKAGGKGVALIDQLKPQGEYLYRLTARNAVGTEFPSEWYKFDTSFYSFVSMPQLTWKKRDALEIEWEFSHPLPMEISWKSADGKDTRKVTVKADEKGVALIDQLKPQGEYLYRFTAQGATEPEFTSEWYKFDTSFYRFVSMPQLRWKKRDTLQIEWEFSHPLPMEISWERADGTGRRKIPVKAGRKGVALIDQLKPQGEYIYRFTAQGATELEFISKKYKFDTSFYYRLPSKPQKPNPFAEDGEMKMVQSAAKQILSKNEFNQGYALILGSAGGRLAYELASQTEMQVVVVEPDVAKAHAARKALTRAGLYGVRVSVHQGNLDDLPYGPYFANLITSGSLLTEGNLPGLDASQLMHVLRPAGGVIMLGHMAGKLNEQTIKDWFRKGGSQREGEPQCTVSKKIGELWAYAKRGKLDGAGDWTHQYGSAENTTNSGDDLVGGDLGILWWGEPGPRPMPDRGGRNPAPLAANGRMFVQGDRVLFGLDAYNGTVLWTFFSPEMRRSNMPRDGSNMVATDDTLFVTIGSECVALDAQTGKRRTAVHAAKGRDWSWLSASKGQLLTTTVKNAVKDGFDYKADEGEWYEGFDAGKVERVVSDTLVSHDPANGKEQWAYRGGAMMNSTLTVADDTIYFVESRNTNLVRSATSRVMPDQLTSQYLVALDRVTGRKLWEKSVNFSKCKYMLYLVHAGDTLVAAGSGDGNVYHTYAYDVSSPSLRFKDNPQNPDVPPLWEHHDSAGKRFNGDINETHHGGLLQHPLVVKETFFSDNRAFDLRTGEVDADIKFPRRRGCGNMAASNRSMFFRHHSQEIWDFDSGTDTTTTLKGSRTGCWLGMIPAQGLLLVPESSGGCSCLNENITIQTSAAWAPRTALRKPKK